MDKDNENAKEEDSRILTISILDTELDVLSDVGNEELSDNEVDIFLYELRQLLLQIGTPETGSNSSVPAVRPLLTSNSQMVEIPPQH